MHTQGVPSECVDHGFRYKHLELCTATQKLEPMLSVCNGAVGVISISCSKVGDTCWDKTAASVPDDVGLVFASVGVHDALYTPDAAAVLRNGVRRFVRAIGTNDARKRAGGHGVQTRVVFMDVMPLCATTSHDDVWPVALKMHVAEVLADFNTWLATCGHADDASPHAEHSWGTISGHRLVAGRCGWSADGIHYYYQVRAAVVAALLKGIDPNDSCGLVDSRANSTSAAAAKSTCATQKQLDERRASAVNEGLKVDHHVLVALAVLGVAITGVVHVLRKASHN